MKTKERVLKLQGYYPVVMILQAAIIIFLILEGFNVIVLYFNPGDTKANAMGAFLLWEESKSDPNTHLVLKYMANWVAGTKLIFIFLLIVILMFGDVTLQFYGLLALVIAILSYFWRLGPLMKVMDDRDMIQPKGYSKALNVMITTFVVVLATAGIVDFYLI